MRTTLCFLLIALAVAQICAMPAAEEKAKDANKKATDAAKGELGKGADAATAGVAKAQGASKGVVSSMMAVGEDVAKLGKDSMDVPSKAAGTMASGFTDMFKLPSF